MESRNINDSDSSDSDSEGFESFKASAEINSRLTQMQSAISVLLSALTTIQAEYNKQTDQYKKIVLLSKTLESIGIENGKKMIQQANMFVNLFDTRKDIFEIIDANEENVARLTENIAALDKLFNELLEEVTCAPIRLFATSLDQAKPEEVDSAVNTCFTMFAAKKPTEVAGEKVSDVSENKNSM